MTATWTIDQSHSLAEFSVRHMMVATAKGQFQTITGTARFDEGDLTTASVEATIDVASITTRDAKRDEHLRSADFFEVEAHPTITFKSTGITKKRDDRFDIAGDLTIRGVTRSVVLDTTFNGIGTSPWGTSVAGFEAETEINRKDFGLEWNVALETGGVLVSDKVKIHLEVELIKQG
ncbi:MAG: YceI family protein [Thermomicrobiales bacterium]|nr:YceI family protein [Thermomicrobiales bacterium]